MKRSQPLRRSQPIKRRNPRWDADWRRARTDVKARSVGYCEARVTGVCTTRGEHIHHIILRSRGGPDEPWNLMHLCNACHTWAHANPKQATRLGIIGSKPPR